MATRITKETLKLLRDLADYRILSASQLTHLHFPGKRAARRRMQRLCGDKYVEILPGSTSEGGGRPENLYGLAKNGLGLLRSEGFLDERIDFEQAGGANLSNQVAHQVLLGWCRIHLVHLCRECARFEHQILTCNSSQGLVPETGIPLVRAEVNTGDGCASAHFTPDAAFIITDMVRSKSLLFFLEVDMGTEPLSSVSGGDIRGKVARYKRYFRSNGYKSYEKTWNISPLTGFRLLFVAHSASRMEALCSLTKTLSPSDFVWVTSADRMFAEGISGDIWARAGRSIAALESILGDLSRVAPLPKLAD